MPKVLIVCAHRPKRSPSQRYRFEQYLPFLESKGFHFEFSYLLNEQEDKIFYAQGRLVRKVFILIKSVLIRLRDLFRLRRYDVIFIQREASFLGTSFFEKRAARSGAHVVFDFDDSIWLADTSPGNKKWEWIKKPEKFFDNVKYAHTVIAGNAYLADKALPINRNTVVIPTTIDTAFHIPKPELRNNGPVCIGWSGSISTVKHFESLTPVLLALKEKYGALICFKLIGDATYKNALFNVKAVAWHEETEVNELNTLDIGVMPLPDDEWARGKCGLKGLSYMACGVPTVMSAVGVNTTIIDPGKNGFLANDPREWFERLSELIDDTALRKQLGDAGRQTVVEGYSVEAHKGGYLAVFENSRFKI